MEAIFLSLLVFQPASPALNEVVGIAFEFGIKLLDGLTLEEMSSYVVRLLRLCLSAVDTKTS